MTAGLRRLHAKNSKNVKIWGAEENTMPIKSIGRDQRAGCEPRGPRRTAGHAFLLAVKHGHGDLLPDLDLVRIRNVACGGNVGIMVRRPIKAVAYLR